MIVVAIEAGHGINTPGKRTPDGEREWTFNNKVVVSAIARLNQYNGVNIIRLDDPTGQTDVPLINRTNKANNAKATILVSFHHNADKGVYGSHGGTETFTLNKSLPETERIARILHNKIVPVYGLRDRGLKKKDLHMLRESHMTAVLLEGGFMDSLTDIGVLRNPDILKRAGIALADGIAQVYGLKLKVGPAIVEAIKKPVYRIRESWGNAKSQKGAYADLNSAIEISKQNPGYEVYNESGVQVFPAINNVNPSVPVENQLKNLYRVRKSWEDAKSQIVAYINLNSAISAANSNPGYNVYDQNGVLVHTGVITNTNSKEEPVKGSDVPNLQPESINKSVSLSQSDIDVLNKNGSVLISIKKY